MRKVKVYDTTLRDGAQGEGISFSLEDKLRIAKRLDELGLHYIEGGQPGSNPKDIRFFNEVKKASLRRARVAAFGSTRKAKNRVSDDPTMKALLRAKMEVVTIFGKSWTLHVKDVLRTTPEENLRMVEDSVRYMKSKGKEVIFDAEHFFDGYKEDEGYALETIKAAEKAGADWVILCDTNGGSIPSEIREGIRAAGKEIRTPLGIHTHNDSGMAVGNTIVAVEGGVSQVQGTINGYGERCGNADLCAILPILQLKLGIRCVSSTQLRRLLEVSRYIDELANRVPHDHQPFIGVSAFCHKGGIHVDAIQKTPKSYEHIDPSLVGNRRRVLISELSGRSTVLRKAEEFGLDLRRDDPETKRTIKVLKELESQGYQFEAADASFELLMRKAMGKYRKLFDVKGFRVIVERGDKEKTTSEATIKVKIKGKEQYTVAEGDGPVDALANALRKALKDIFPSLEEMHLSDFKVRVLNPQAGTAARVRTLIQSRDGRDSWETVGVSENIIEASWEALVEGVEYKLLKDLR